MPRVARIAPGGLIYHVYNRANGKGKLFQQDADYAAFVERLAQVKEMVPVRVLAYCLMPNHWHLVLWPRHDGDLSKFLLCMTTAHVRRNRLHYRRPAGGQLYQGRFKNFPIQPDEHLLTVAQYIESNSLRAKLAKRANKWSWSSLAGRQSAEGKKLLDEWPVKRPANWADMVSDPIDAKELESIRMSISRGRPYGTPAWVNRTADRYGLESTMRPRGRPRKVKAEGKKKK